MAFLMAGTVNAAAESCTTNTGFDENGMPEFSQDCKDGEGGGGAGGFWSGPWGIAIEVAAGLAVVGGGALYTRSRITTRRKLLNDYIAAIDQAFLVGKTQPSAAIPRLAQLRRETHARYEEGRFEDAQYLALDRKSQDAIITLRLMQLERDFPSLPAELHTEVRRLVGDGTLSETDVTHIDSRARAVGVPAATRTRLAQNLRGWVDTVSLAPHPEPKPRRLAVVAASAK